MSSAFTSRIILRFSIFLISSIEFSRCGDYLASASADTTIKIWHLKDQIENPENFFVPSSMEDNGHSNNNNKTENNNNNKKNNTENNDNMTLDQSQSQNSSTIWNDTNNCLISLTGHERIALR